MSRLKVAVAVVVMVMLAAAPASAQMLPASQEEPPTVTPAVPDPTAKWPWSFKRASNLTWTRTTLSGTFLRVTGAGGSRTTGGLTAGTDMFAVGNLGVLALEEHIGGALGGGGGGFEGEGFLETLVGVRGYVTDVSGPFVRAGLSLETVGNDATNLQYAGLLAKAGYQHIAPPVAFEVGVLGGGIFGTWYIGSRQRDLTRAPVLGAYALLGEKPAWARVEWRHIMADGLTGPLPVDELTTSGCFVLIAKAYGFCLDTKLIGGGVAPLSAAPSPATSTYAGVSFGLTAEGARLVTRKP